MHPGGNEHRFATVTRHMLCITWNTLSCVCESIASSQRLWQLGFTSFHWEESIKAAFWRSCWWNRSFSSLLSCLSFVTYYNASEQWHVLVLLLINASPTVEHHLDCMGSKQQPLEVIRGCDIEGSMCSSLSCQNFKPKYLEAQDKSTSLLFVLLLLCK